MLSTQIPTAKLRAFCITDNPYKCGRKGNLSQGDIMA